MLKALKLLAVSLAAVLACAAGAGAVTVDMKQATHTDPWEVVPTPDGGVWFADKGSLLTHVSADGNIFIYLSSFYAFGIGPSMVSDPTGVTWSAGTGLDKAIARTDAVGAITYSGALPFAAMPYKVAWGPDNALWFTEWNPSPSTTAYRDRIGRRAADGTITDYGGLSAGAQASTLITGPDGNLWFLEPGISSIGRITPSGVVTEFPLPAGMTLAYGRGREMTFGPGGDLYFLIPGAIARMTSAGVVTGTINGGLADFDPNAVAYGKDGNLWVTECTANTVTRVSPSGVATRAPEGTFPTRACPMGITANADGVPWLYEWNTGRAGRLLFSSPLATTDDPTDVDTTAAALNGTAAPRGVATTVHFEYGTTSTYGRATPGQSIGDGDDTASITARPTDLQPSTTYHYRLVASSVIGTTTGADHTVTTSAVPPPAPPPPPADRDGDGYPVTVDCDDLSAAIHPGANDKPGDRIDQDCSGADAAYQRFQPHADAAWKTVHGRIVFTRLTIDEMPAGSSLKLTCTGPGCDARAYSATVSKSTRHLDVSARLKKAKLRKGATIELQLSRPGYITTVVRWTIGPPPRVTILCVPPGATKAKAC
jgi:streptogramin lyase